ncbi:hypothetical protein VP01_3453g3 [Puccinia sorghi]|uniref:Uncharacterized protein n=1 Tax=Puccinia sorghi TaxID=27349 RepID=A0A0L6UW89_9BASI|nr:hypothetical protein VP01_3453g3 [Puccinia sorghi]
MNYQVYGCLSKNFRHTKGLEKCNLPMDCYAKVWWDGWI